MPSKRTLALLLAVGLPVGAAIVIPSWLRSRVQGGESPVIGDARSVLSAQTAYASANGGFYDTLECLAAPRSCIPGYAAGGPSFIDESLASLGSRHGYAGRFHPGPRPSAQEIEKAGASPTSVRAFAYVLVPEKPGETGVRSFCVDSQGVLCSRLDGTMPPISDGRCPAGCPPLQ